MSWGLAFFALVSQAGCLNTGDITGQMIPHSWRGNPWGPDAEAARRCGRLPSIPSNPSMSAWDAWGRGHLRDGDIVFRMGDARIACGLYPFSQISAEMADSRYSHTGIVAWENGEPVVYDTNKLGPRKQPFPIWVLDVAGGIAVKRPDANNQRFVSGALVFCRDTYQRQVPFDRRLSLDQDQFYCIELTERAYRSAGLVLSEPIRIDHLPRYQHFPKAVWFARHFSPVRPDQSAFVIGNDSIGIWSSRALTLIYEAPDARFPYAEPGEVTARSTDAHSNSGSILR
ncbi:YiiX/YebB-like N1pC/P60 family cysteine hydrolase [Singulisphaera sp. GP187]|uniref:YiiX/YebB-like N1pC/P60 family cysteine hydrolase n=1 Tax=Singulisphaera sp. GP187 TaxID=1882752 RepID=UPI0020B10557|nr:YiiX/YebB-like N1pC/P60 family cysteine hydrolase [Singulisphaera sp. GP187]